jgi:aromatic ring-cleaving dioxygenase
VARRDQPEDRGAAKLIVTENSYDDHSKNALWLGTPVPMKLDILRPKYSEGLLPTAQRP